MEADGGELAGERVEAHDADGVGAEALSVVAAVTAEHHDVELAVRGELDAVRGTAEEAFDGGFALVGDLRGDGGEDERHGDEHHADDGDKRARNLLELDDADEAERIKTADDPHGDVEEQHQVHKRDAERRGEHEQQGPAEHQGEDHQDEDRRDSAEPEGQHEAPELAVPGEHLRRPWQEEVRDEQPPGAPGHKLRRAGVRVPEREGECHGVLRSRSKGSCDGLAEGFSG